MKSVGFKEWAVVCEALGRGAQTIILRKGGIAEGRDGFSFQHRAFFLFPTWFHEQPQKVRDTKIKLPEATADTIELKFYAQLEFTRTITSWSIAASLEPLHILQPEVVRERFDYDESPGVHVAFVRVFRVVPSWTLPNDKKYGGCRSWVSLPESGPELCLEPVLTDDDYARRREEFSKIVGSG